MVETKKERISEWVERWDDSQWNSKEFRHYLIDLIRDGDEAHDKLREIEPIFEKQAKYIECLERQLDLLQKTLDIIEKTAPRPIFLHDMRGDK